MRGERYHKFPIKQNTLFYLPDRQIIFCSVLVCERCGDPEAKHHARLSCLLIATATTKNWGMLLRLGHEGTFWLLGLVQGIWDIFFWVLDEVIDCAI